MFKIGDFSKIGLVSIKTLRHYAEIGLLQPAYIDDQTGYRYYQVDQLPRLNQIMALKDLGFSLSQVKTMLDDNLSVDDMRELLAKRRSQIQEQIQAEMQRLAWIEAKIDFVEREGKMPNSQPMIKNTPAMNVLAIREPAPNMSNWGEMITRTHTALAKHGVLDIPQCFAVFHGDEYDHEMVDWELAFPVNTKTSEAIEVMEGRRLEPRQVPAVEVAACLVHRGSYATLSQGYSSLAYWIKQNGYEISGAGREVYLKIGFQHGNPADNLTEIQFPVKPFA